MALKRNVRGGQPSPYPRFIFHGLRTAQLLGAAVVSGIMAFFMYYLRKEKYPVPWTFIVLMSVSLATIAALLVTIILYNFTYLSPRFNLILNGSLSLIWGLGLGLLTWSISASHVLQNQCTARRYGGEPQAGICKDYKALWAMALCGTVSTFLAFLLDVHTQRKVNRLGVYVKPADDQAAQRLNDMKTMRVRSAGYEAPEEQHDVTARGVEWQQTEEDIAYHNRYGAEEEIHGPLDSNGFVPQGVNANRSPGVDGKKDMGYHGGFFRD